MKEKVEKYAAEWSKYANIKFSFIQSGDADIRISFKNSGSWSCLGNCPCEVNGKNPTQNEPTMNFGWLTSNSPDYEYSRVVLHEFGHALGFTHEHQSPDSDIPWDRNAVIEYYSRSQGWSEEETGRNIFSKYGKDETNFSSYDENSIMHYAIPDELTVGDFSTRWNTEFSPTDKNMLLYFIHAQTTERVTMAREKSADMDIFLGIKIKHLE